MNQPSVRNNGSPEIIWMKKKKESEPNPIYMPSQIQGWLPYIVIGIVLAVIILKIFRG